MTPDSWLRNDGMSIYQIAKLLGITPRRVQQIEASALAKLRRRPRLLREFLGLNDHLGDDTFEAVISARSGQYGHTPALPRPKEGASR